MKNIVSKAALGLLVGGAVLSAFAGGPDVPPAPMVTPGLYIGLGGSWNTVDVQNVVDGVETNIPGSPGVALSYHDHVDQQLNRLAPMGQIGYWSPIDSEWLWGLQANYKFINARFEDYSLPNAGAVWSADPTNGAYLKTRLTHELFLMAYFGMQFNKGYFYLGGGPVMFRIAHKLGDPSTSVSNAAGTRFHLSETVFTNTDTVWGGGAQIGYNYYFKPDWFLGFSYTYVVTGDNDILGFTTKNTNLSGLAAGLGGSADDTVRTNNSTTVQEVMFSINKVFAV